LKEAVEEIVEEAVEEMREAEAEEVIDDLFLPLPSTWPQESTYNKGSRG
jgi:hypothetical protein